MTETEGCHEWIINFERPDDHHFVQLLMALKTINSDEEAKNKDLSLKCHMCSS